MKSNVINTALLAVLAWAPSSQAQVPWLQVDGQINFDGSASSANEYERNLRVQDAELRFEIMVREGIRIIVKTELEKKLNKATWNDKFELGQFLEEAFIQIETDKISGLPRAIVTAGKHQVAFGQNYTELPMFKDALLYSLSKEDEVVGLTVELPMNFFKIVDSVAISMFEAGAGDLKISDEKGSSIKVSKNLTDQLQAQISYLTKDQAGKSDKETRTSVGFVFKGKDGSYKVWAEGIIVKNNPLLIENTQGGRIGGSYQVGPGAVVVEYSYLDRQAKELAVAYNLPVNTWMVLSPEIRRRQDLTGSRSDETVVGIRARIQARVVGQKGLKTGQK